MKKRVKEKYAKNPRLLIIFGIIILAILALLLIKNFTGKSIDVSSQDPLNIGTNLEKIPQNPDDAKDISTTYLKQEWEKILNKTSNPVGKVLWATNNVLHALSPVFKLLVGVEYSFSWLFWLSFFVWIAIVIIIYLILKEPLQFKWWLSLSISVIIIAIGAQSGIISKLVLFASPLLDNTWMIWGAIMTGIIIVYLYSYLMKQFGKTLKEKQKKEDEERREQKAETVEKIHDIEIKTRGGK